MFQKVLVGYDGFPASKDALALAQRLLDREQGVLILVCTYPYSIYEPHIDGGAYVEAIRKRAEETLEEGKNFVTPGIKVETLPVAAASPAQGLSFIAEDQGVDLLVLGSTHHSPIGRTLLGSTSERLLHAAPCAVAVAPRDLTRTDHFRHIGVGYDGSPESRAALEAAFKLAEETGSEVSTFTVEIVPTMAGIPGMDFAYSTREEIAKEQSRAAVESVRQQAPEGLEVHTWVLQGEPEHAIIEKAQENSDILFVGSRAYGAVKRAFLGSVSTGLLRHAPFPVLVMPRGADATRTPTP